MTEAEKACARAAWEHYVSTLVKRMEYQHAQLAELMVIRTRPRSEAEAECRRQDRAAVDALLESCR